jgi:hypothetical protein
MNKANKTMKKLLAVLVAVSFLSAPAASVSPFAAQPAAAQEPNDRFSRQQLENLLAPVALYPDPLLAQVLVAATFDQDVEEASRLLRSYRNLPIDDQPWDVSVRAVAHYSSVIHMMADKIDWTVALGQAYVEQPQDVMAAVQFLRWQARKAGNLATGQYHQVIVDRDYIEIVPYRPDFIYVPVYDPGIIFFHPAAVITWGVAFPIGVWLIHDFDWVGHRVYYHGWSGNRAWIVRSRPNIRITNVYVNNNLATVRVNRNIVQRNVNVTNLSRFNTVNRNVNFTNVERRNQARGSAGDIRAGQRNADNLQKGGDRGGAGVATKSVRTNRSELKQKEQSPGVTGNQSLQSQGTKSSEAKGKPSASARQLDRSKQQPDKNSGQDQMRRGRQGPDNQGQPNNRGAQGGEERGREKQPEAKQKKHEEKKPRH